MKVTYDIEYLPKRKQGGKKSEEVLKVIEFLAGQHKNMRFEYDDDKECKRKYDTVRNYRRANKLQTVFDMFRQEKCMYVIKIKKTGKKAEMANECA